jgi:hypothetical protein
MEEKKGAEGWRKEWRGGATTKTHVPAFNGFATARSCSPMNRLFEHPRGAAINEIVKKFLEIKQACRIFV